MEIGGRMEKRIKLLSRYSSILDRELAGGKTGVLLTAVVSFVNILLLFPFFGGIHLVNISKLFAGMGITKEMAGSLYTSYSVLNLLSSVQESGEGRIGLYAMILLVIAAAVICIIRRRKNWKKG